jgi:outer membrane protein
MMICYFSRQISFLTLSDLITLVMIKTKTTNIMKKTLLTICALMLLNAAFAQFNQGRMLVGGSLGFSSTSNKANSGGTITSDNKETILSVSPNFGYFVVDNVAVGGSLTYISDTYKSTGGYSSTSSELLIGPFVRYYVAPGFFGQGAVAIGSESGPTANLTKWSLGVGYAHFLNDHVAIEPLIYYGSLTGKNNGVTASTSGLYFSVGIQAYLGDRK